MATKIKLPAHLKLKEIERSLLKQTMRPPTEDIVAKAPDVMPGKIPGPQTEFSNPLESLFASSRSTNPGAIIGNATGPESVPVTPPQNILEGLFNRPPGTQPMPAGGPIPSPNLGGNQTLRYLPPPDTETEDITKMLAGARSATTKLDPKTFAELPPEVLKYWGLEDTRFTHLGEEAPAGYKGRAYPFYHNTREGALSQMGSIIKDWEGIDLAKRGELPVNLKTTSKGTADVFMKVDKGKGNYGPDKDIFVGKQTSGDFFGDRSAKDVFNQWFKPSAVSATGKKGVALKEVLDKDVPGRKIMFSLEEAVEAFNQYISRDRTNLRLLVSSFNEGKVAKQEFYTHYMWRKLDKKGWERSIKSLEESQKKVLAEKAQKKALWKDWNEEKVNAEIEKLKKDWLKRNGDISKLREVFKVIDRGEEVAGLLKEHKELVKRVKTTPPQIIEPRAGLYGEQREINDVPVHRNPRERTKELEELMEELAIERKLKETLNAAREPENPFPRGMDTLKKIIRSPQGLPGRSRPPLTPPLVKPNPMFKEIMEQEVEPKPYESPKAKLIPVRKFPELREMRRKILLKWKDKS